MQLEALLDDSPICAPARLRTLRSTHRSLQQQHVDEGLMQQRTIKGLEEQLDASQAQVQRLQQQLAEAQSQSRQ